MDELNGKLNEVPAPAWVGMVAVSEFDMPTTIVNNGKSSQSAITFTIAGSMDTAFDLCNTCFETLSLAYFNRPYQREYYAFHNAMVAIMPGASHERVRMVMIYSSFEVKKNEQ